MRRREFITTAGAAAAAAAWRFVGHAQQSMPVIGFLNSASPGPFASFVQAFREGLGSMGYFEGQNVTIEYRWAKGQYDRLPALAGELVSHRVNVIAATGGEPSAFAAKAATSTIPIVFAIGGDPTKVGLVSSLNRPSANMTGVTLFTNVLGAKRLELLTQLIPNATHVAVLLNPNNPNSQMDIMNLQAAARSFGREITFLRASTVAGFKAAFATLAQQRGVALLVNADPFFNSQKAQLAVLAARYSIPTIYELRGFAISGGLASYGSSIIEAYRRVGVYSGQILKGAKPGDLPIIQPTSFELVINLRTAKALGLDVSPMLIARADEVIE
jgi:putative ABC transport system substrate-binding protein